MRRRNLWEIRLCVISEELAKNQMSHLKAIETRAFKLETSNRLY